MTTLKDLSLPQLRKLVRIRERIEALDKEASRIIGSTESLPITNHATPKPRRSMTAATKAKIARAQRRIWKTRRAHSLVV